MISGVAMEDAVVDLTCPTPEPDRSDAPLPEIVSLLTPELSKRGFKEAAETRQLKKKKGNGESSRMHLDIEGGTTSPVTDSLRKYIAQRQGLPPPAARRLNPETQQSPQIAVAASHPTAPLPSPREQQQHPTDRPEPVSAEGQSEQPTQGCMDVTVEAVGALSLKKSIEKPPAARHLLFPGMDDVVIELSEDLQQSFISTALIRMLDELKKDGKQTFTTFICRRRAALLPGRRCISWLRKIKNPNHATHKHLPYLLLLLEVHLGS